MSSEPRAAGVRVLATALVAAALLGVAGARAADLTFATPISGDSVPVTLSLADGPAGDRVEITVSIPSGQGDLLGLFGNVLDESLVAGMDVDDPTGVVTQWQFQANEVWKVGGGNTMSPVKDWDWGVRLGATGSSGGAVTSASFALVGAGLDVDQLVAALNQGWVFGVRVQGTTGSEGSAKIGLSGDAPRIRIDSPTNGALLGETPVTVSGTVLGSNVSVDVDGVAASLLGSTFSADVALSEGPHTLVATASNALGTATDSVAVTLDATPPVVVIAAPPDGTVTADAEIQVSGTVSDASPISSFTLNGVEVAQSGGAYQATVPLVAGENSIVAEATDAAGNVGSAAITVVRGEVPTIAIDSPLPGALVAPGLVTVSGTVTGVPEPTVTVNGVPASVSNGTFSADVPVSVGAGSLVATASNALGDVSDEVLVTVGTAPGIAIQSPADGSSTDEASITVSGTVSGTAPLAVSVEGVTATVSGGTFSAVVPLETGANTLVATVSNAFGSDSDQVSVTRTSSIVTVEIDFPADGAEIESTFVTVQLDAFSSAAPIDSVLVNGNPAFRNFSGGWILTLPLASGENTIAAVATDELGNTGSASITVFRIDPIFVTIDEPAPGATLTSANVLVSGDAPGATQVLVNGVLATLSGDQYSAQIVLVEGPNTILVEATGPGRAGSASRSVELDTTPPAITIDTPGDGTTTARDTVTVRGQASDANGISEIRVDGVAAGSGPSFVGTAILTPGANTVTVDAVDGVGNAGTVAVQVTYDPNQPLAISIGTPSDAALLSKPRVDVAGSVSDPMAVVTVNGTSGAISGSQYTAPQVPLVEGENVLVATAVRGTESVTASVMVTFNRPPDVRITSPRVGDLLTSASVDVAGIVDDAAARVDVNGVVASVGSDGRFVALGVPLALGQNELLARAVDLLGAASSDGVTVERRDQVASRLRVVLVDPARCPFPPTPACAPVDLVVEDDEDFADGLAEIGLPRERFGSPIREAAVADHVFHAFVFAEAPGEATLRLAGPGPEISGAESPRTLEPIGGLATEVAAAGLDPALADLLPPDDFTAGYFTRFALAPVQPGPPLTVTAVPYGGRGYPVGNRPVRVVLADFDEDGFDDLVSINNETNDLSLLLSNGDDTLQPEVRLPALLGPAGVAAGDLDGDGHLDLATLNAASDRLSVLLGNGDGTFQSLASSFPAGSGEDVLLADFDADGALDVASPDRSAGEINLLLGNGDGTFQGLSRIPANRDPVRIAAADVNDDGFLDLVAASDGRDDTSALGTEIQVFLGDGTGQFTALPAVPILESWEFPFPNAIQLADLDGDGIQDVAYSGFVGALSSLNGPLGVRLGNGDGTFAAETDYALDFSPGIQEPVDLDGDGDLDLVALTTRGITTLANDGTGAFSEIETLVSTAINRGTLGDVNGDGFVDIATPQPVSAFRDEFDWVAVFTGRGDGRFRGGRYTAAGQNVTGLAVGDWTNDGITDLLTANAASSDFSLLAGLGDGSFEGERRHPLAPQTGPASLVPGDFDDDGNLDFAAMNTGPRTVSVHLGAGDGSYTDGQVFSSLATSFFQMEMHGGDVDGNATIDLVVNNGQPLGLFRGLGDGTFGSAELIDPGGFPRVFALDDVDGDGNLDLVWGGDDPDLPGLEGAIFVNFGSGDGSFAPPVRSSVLQIPDDFALADVDGDGNLDVAVLNASIFVDGFLVSRVGLLLGNGDGSFGAEETIAQGDRADALRLIAADLDGDGNVDFATSNQLTASVWVIRGNGDGTFRPFEFFAAGLRPGAILATQLDGIGGLDLVAAQPNVPTPDGGDRIAVLLSQLPGVAPDATGRLLASASDANDGVGLRVDVAAPVVQITSPAEGITLSGSSLTLSGTVDDTVPEGLETLTSARLAEVAYRVADDLDVTLAEGLVPVIDGRFTIADLAIGTGVHCATIEALDAAGNVGQDEVCITADPTAPVVSVVSPQPGSTVPFDTVRLDLLFSATTTLVAIDGVPDGRVFPAGLAVDVATLPLEIGANAVDLDFDAGGVAFTVSTTVFRSDVLPRIRIVSPANGALVNTSAVHVTGSVPVGDALVIVNGVIATTTGTSFSADVPLAQEGSNSIFAVELVAGTRDTISVRRDTVPPQLLTILPADGTISSDDSVTFSGTVSEASRVTAFGPSANVSASTAPLAGAASHAFTLPVLSLGAGDNDVTVVAQDAAGNTASAPVRIARSGAALSLVAPSAGSSVPSLRVDLTLDATEPVTLQALYSAGRRVPGAEGLALPAGTSLLNQVPLAAGPTEVRIAYARDSGPTETLSFQLTSTSTDGATVQGTVTDAATGDPIANAQVFVTVNGLTLVALSGADGRYSIDVEAGDLDGVASSEGFASGSFSGNVAAGETFDADLALAPTGLPTFSNEVEILVPPNGTVTDLDLVTVVGNLLDPASSVLVNGIAAEILGSRFTARNVPLAMGSNRIEVQAIVSGSPVATDAVNVERAAEPVLAVTLYSPPDGATSPGNGLVVRGFVSGRGAITAVGGTFTLAEQGVFAVNDVILPVGQHALRAETTLPDRSQTAETAITVGVAELGRALTLRAQPLVGPAPLDVDLSIFTEVSAPFSLRRLDVDTDGDGTIDAFDFPGSELGTVLSEIRGHAPRVFGTLPDGVEVTAAAAVNVHGQPVVVQEFAQGNPVDLAPGPAGGLYVLDASDARVSLYDIDGSLVSSFGSVGVGPDQLLDPQGLGLGPDGEIYVADTGNDRIQVFAADGTFLRSVGGPGQLTAPRDVFVTDDRVLVSDAGSDRLRLFRLDGTAIGALGVASPRHIQALGSHGVVVASPVDQLVSFVDDRVRVLDAALVLRPENRPVAPVDASLGQGTIWVAESNEPVVRVYTPQLEFQQRLEIDSLALAVLASPRREAQSVFVADGARVFEVASPVPSPIPVCESLRSALLAGDAAAALQLIAPIQRELFEQIYADVGADLSAHGAAMGPFEVDLLRANRAIVNTTIVAPGTGETLVVPIMLVRDGSGTWFIADY